MRLLHTMIRVGNLERSLKFYTEALGMKLLRRNEYPEGKFTLAFVGYGNETHDSVIELTYNWDTNKYDLGSAFGHIAIEVPDVYKACEEFRNKGVKITREPGPMKHGLSVIAFIEDPDGYKIELLGPKVLEQPNLPANFLQVFSSWQELSQLNQNIFSTIMLCDETELPRGIKEMIAAVISVDNNCGYSTFHHLESMKEFGIDNDIAENIKIDYRSAKIEERIVKLLDFAHKVSKHASEISQEDLATLKNYNWTEKEILEIIAVVAQTNFFNYFANAFAIELEADAIRNAHTRVPINPSLD